jgi:hypothetical protein
MKTLIFILTLTLSLFAQHEWSEPVQLSEMGISPGTSYTKPVIASNSNGNIYCFWTKSIRHPTESLYCTQIEYRQSNDSGITWSVTENVTPDYTEYSNDRIWSLRAVTDSDNNIHLFHMKGLGFDTNKIIHKMYNGIYWTEPYTITGYSVSNLQVAIDKEDRIYVFWTLNGYQYYSFSDRQENRNWMDPSSLGFTSLNWTITNSNFVFDGDNNLYATGKLGGETGDIVRPCLYSYNRYEEKWNDFEEIGSFTSTSTGCALVLLSDGTLIANVAVGQYIDTNTNYIITKNGGDNFWSSPAYLNKDTWMTSKKMFADSLDNIHLIEQHIIDSRSELIYVTSKYNDWNTDLIQSNEDNSYGYVDASFDGNLDKISIVFTNFDRLNSSTCIYFQSKFIDTGVDGDTSSIPNKPILYKNYPNPFNSSTQIKFTLPKTSDVRLSVYNIKGEFVKDLIYSKQSKGQYSVTFEAGNLNSGIYYYQLVIDGIVKDSKKMLYLK